MYLNKRILAIIPARGGSKGIVDKNIKEVHGQPLIKYTLDAAKSSKYIDRIIVSTDSLKYKKIIDNMNDGYVPFLRPEDLAQDTSPTIDAVVHCIDTLRDKYSEIYDYVVLLQPTSPLRQGYHIDEAVEKIVNSKENSLVSISLVEEHPLLIRTINEDGTVNKLLEQASTVRRQDFPAFYKVNGAIYIQLLENGKLDKTTSFNDGKIGYIMEKEFSVDVDEIEDIDRVERLLNKGNL